MSANPISTPSKLTKKSFQSLLISGVLAGAVVLLVFWLVMFSLQTPAPSTPTLHYTLLGDPAWVENRLWQENSSLRQISHPDWTLNFVLPPSALADHEASVASHAIGGALSFYLDKKLDDFVLTWSQNVLRHQWQKLWQTATPASQKDLARELTLARLNSWTQNLVKQKLTLENVNFYLPLEAGGQIAQTAEITAVWAIRHADQSTELISTPLVINCDPATNCAWDFNLVSLPLFTN